MGLKETSKHKGRYFWSCTNPRVRKGEYQSCDFFQWDDERLVERLTEQQRQATSRREAGASSMTPMPFTTHVAPQPFARCPTDRHMPQAEVQGSTSAATYSSMSSGAGRTFSTTLGSR